MNTKSTFGDFTRFEGDKDERTAERRAFIGNVTYTPAYTYDKLDSLMDDTSLRDKKTAIHEAILELEAAKTEPGADLAELELYAAFHELRLKKIMLVEAARDVNHATTSSEWEVSTRSLMDLNKETYGEFDTPAYLGMIATESDRAEAFLPTTEKAQDIKATLQKLLSHNLGTDMRYEQPLMDNETLQKLQVIINERYGAVLDVVPNTGDDTYYDTQECAEIMNLALVAGGLSEAGWKVVVDPAKANPSTNSMKRIISLPSTTQRNASELRRLIVHEQEVHARRGENGRSTGFRPLQGGTADYADVEEGLGVLFECAVAGTWENVSFDRARDRYLTAGLALGAGGTPRDARQVYEVLWRMIAIRDAENGAISDETIEDARERAYGHVENAFRGTQFWMRGVIYMKLKVYFEGLRKNADFISRNADNIEEALDRAMIGKYDHTDADECDNVLTVLKLRSNV